MSDPSSNAGITTLTQDAMLYAVAHDADGDALDLTVFEAGAACTARLTKPLVEQLVQLLSRRSSTTTETSDFDLVDGRIDGVLHPDFKPASWRGTTNTDGKIIGVSLNVADGSVARFALNLSCAISLAETILDYARRYADRTNSHSESSSGNPSVDVSRQRE